MSTSSTTYLNDVDIYMYMAYTEIQQRDDKKYYYRVQSVRKNGKVTKKRVYLGVNLNKMEIRSKEKDADIELLLLSTLLSDKQIKELDKLKKDTSNLSYEAFVSLFTYDSTNIEGNTFTLQQTAQLLFEGITPSKSLREINEIINHKEAFDYLLHTKSNISRKLILNLHKIVTKNTLKTELADQIGIYRTVQVYIRGVEWLPTETKNVPSEMAQLLSWYTKNKTKINPLILAAYFHVTFEKIHPFVDGNGRVGRLLMNFMLRKHNFPMINIPHKLRFKYYETLEEAQVKGNLKPFIDFLYELLVDAKIRF
jgi:Fic family protein